MCLIFNIILFLLLSIKQIYMLQISGAFGYFEMKEILQLF